MSVWIFLAYTKCIEINIYIYIFIKPENNPSIGIKIIIFFVFIRRNVSECVYYSYFFNNEYHKLNNMKIILILYIN